MKHFHYLSDLGETHLPTEAEIAHIRVDKNERFLLILDSSVCLDIINLIKHKKNANVDKQKVFTLIEYVQKNKVEQTPIFALTELCYDRKTFNISDGKLWDMKNKLDFAFKYPIKLLKRFQFDYETNYHIYHEPKLLRKSIEPFAENLNLYYAGLLKIRELAKNGLKKEFSERNIESFIEWMSTELNTMLGLEFSLALEIFGGNSNLRSMIKLGSAKDKAIKGLWGTAWDLFHARVSCNRPQLADMVGEKVQPIFVTKDNGLFELMSPHVEHYLRFNSTKLTITTENTYPPHYSESFMTHLNKKMLELGTERVAKNRINNLTRTNSIIRELEKNLT